MTVDRRYALLKHTHTADEIEGGGGGGSVESVTADEVNVTVDNTDPANPVVALFDMPEATVKGREEGAGTGAPVNLTMDELRAMLHLGSGSEVRGASFTGSSSEIRLPAPKVNLTIKEDCTIVKCVVLTQGGTGSCEIDIQKESYAGFPPDSSDSIVGATPPTITNDIKYQDTALTDWDTVLSAGDTLQFELVSVDVFSSVFVFLILEPVGSTATDGYTDDRVRDIVIEEINNFDFTTVFPTSVPAVADTIPLRDGDAYMYSATPPDGDSSTKVATTEFVNSDNDFVANGYYIHANGFIEQWGFDTRTGSAAQTVTFPIAFPTACLNIQLTIYDTGGSSGQASTLDAAVSASTTSFQLNHADAIVGTYWRAIGY